MPKALLTATVQSHIAQFHEPAIRLLHDHGYEVHVAARNNLAEKNGLTLTSPDRVFDVPFERNPLSPRNALAFRRLRAIVRDGDYDIIHCNTPVAGVLTRLVGQKARAKGSTLLYTAHGFHFFDGAPLANWLFYYPLERALAHLTDVLVTINKEDYARAARFPAGMVRYLPGVGVDPKRFRHVDEGAKVLERRRLRYGPEDYIVIAIGELNDNKDQRTTILAMVELLAFHPNVKLLLAGNGPRRTSLGELAERLGIADQVLFLGYRTDLEKYLSISDVLVSASHREGLGLNVIEAMLSGLPVLASKNRGHADLVEDGKTGWLFDTGDERMLARRLNELRQDPELARQLGEAGRRAAQSFTVEAVLVEMKRVYDL